MLVYKLSTPSESGKKKGDGPYEDHTGSKGRPGVTAGIALGSISGFALLAFLIFYGAKMYKRRRQRQSSENDEHGAGDTPLASSAADLGKTNRADLRNVDPIVVDFAPMSGDLRASNAPRPKQIIAASTGAEWRTGNPGTPRSAGDAAPKPATAGARNDGWDDIPHTPTILHPESAAQNPGLGERAWHRRRLSTPQPPAGYRYSDGPDPFGGKSSRGPGETTQTSSQGTTGEVGKAPWEDDWDSLMPAPLTLPPLGPGVAGGASASAEEDGGPLTAKTMWTVPSDPSLSGSSGKTVERGGKTGKTE